MKKIKMNPLRKLKIFSRKRLKCLRRKMMNRTLGINQDTQKVRVKRMHRRDRIAKYGEAKKIVRDIPATRDRMKEQLEKMKVKKLTKLND